MMQMPHTALVLWLIRRGTATTWRELCDYFDAEDTLASKLLSELIDLQDAGLIRNGLVSTSSTPAVDWDGVHIFLRYQSEESLYYASVNRRDGHVVIKKKCIGGPSNGGTYYTLTDKSGHAFPTGSWQTWLQASRTGGVALKLDREGAELLSVTDTGPGVRCDHVAWSDRSAWGQLGLQIRRLRSNGALSMEISIGQLAIIVGLSMFIGWLAALLNLCFGLKLVIARLNDEGVQQIIDDHYKEKKRVENLHIEIRGKLLYHWVLVAGNGEVT